ncbi:MAG: hypothetical protein RIR97_2045, partial [Pseudomonadota bacterium]
LGIQDFDPNVQDAINRIQTFEQTRHVVESVRRRGVGSVNCDVLYGLPYQTEASVLKTLDAVISLDPDRIALFGYAHVPWMKKHQSMIRDSALPDVYARFSQMQAASHHIRSAGYAGIGIDHFAKTLDRMALADEHQTLRRNFQGYTDDQADALIGLGASSIGQLPEGYVQNCVTTGDYIRAAETGNLCAVRGIQLEEDDRMRAFVIEQLMCRFEFGFDDLQKRFGRLAGDLVAQARLCAARDRDGLVEIHDRRFVILEKGRPFARTIASWFDAYLGNGVGRHSIAV